MERVNTGIFNFLLGSSDGWEEIEMNELPSWANDRIGYVPYFHYKVVKGNHYLYKVWNTAEVQGGSLKVYKKKRF